MWSLYSSDPLVVGSPFTSNRSLIEIGTPCSAPSASPRMTAASASCAAAIAISRVTSTYAFSAGLMASMRSSIARVSSTGDNFFARMAAAISVAGM